MKNSHLIVAAIVLSAQSIAAASDSRPNVLFLFADDQRADTIASLGNLDIKTPNLDRLVRRGLVFDRAYMQGGFNGATCVPSRAMLLSGRSLFHIDETLLRDDSWPAAFGRAGYSTFISGKWHNGEQSLGRCFQQARSIFANGMTDPLTAKLSDLVDGHLTPPQVGAKHACAVFADEAIRFLHEKHDRPFFCYIPFNAPHDPHVVPSDFKVKYEPDKIPLPPNFLPQHLWNNGEMTVRDEALLAWPRPPEKVREMIADYYRYVSFLDEEIGRVLDALEASPHASNTIVVFASDSGVARGSHGLLGKQNCYEHSLRVPLIITGPGIPQGQRTSALCYLFDVLPTLGTLCGISGPTSSEGLELTAVTKEPTQAARPQLVFAYKGVQRAICDDRWKLIRYPQIDRSQLFDLKADPHEITNLVDQPEHKAKVEELMTRLEKELSECGDKQSLKVSSPDPAEWVSPKAPEDHATH